MLLRHIQRQLPARLPARTPAQSSTALRTLHASTSQRADQASSSSSSSRKLQATSDSETPPAAKTEKPTKPKHKLSARERDEAMMQRMKERMGQEGDEAWEDGRPAESGLPRNVKNNMFRLI